MKRTQESWWGRLCGPKYTAVRNKIWGGTGVKLRSKFSGGKKEGQRKIHSKPNPIGHEGIRAERLSATGISSGKMNLTQSKAGNHETKRAETRSPGNRQTATGMSIIIINESHSRLGTWFGSINGLESRAKTSPPSQKDGKTARQKVSDHTPNVSSRKESRRSHVWRDEWEISRITDSSSQV